MKDSHFFGSYGVFGIFYNVKDAKDLKQRILELEHGGNCVPILIKTVKQYAGSGNRDWEYKEWNGKQLWQFVN